MTNEHNNAPAVPQDMRLVPVSLLQELESSMYALGQGLDFTSVEADRYSRLREFIAATPAPSPAQDPASAFTKSLEIRLSPGWNLTGNAIPVLYTDTINDYQVRRDDVWLCTTDALKTKQEVGLTDEQKTWAVNQLMEQAQVFASAWSLVGGKFDFGNALEEAEQAKSELREMIIDALREKGQQS